MTDHVELPAGVLIDYLDLARAMARAAHPVAEAGATGMACVTGKLARSILSGGFPRADLPRASQQDELQLGGSPLASFLSTFEFSQTIRVTAREPEQPDLLSGAPTGVKAAAATELLLPCKLTSEERQRLAKLLPQLPELRHPISADRRTEFMAAYRKLAGDIHWEPILLTERDVEAQRQRQEHTYVQFRQALRDEVSSGRLVACNAFHIPVKALGPGSFIPRQSAIDYLTRYGFACKETGVGSAVKASRSIDPAQPVSESLPLERPDPVAIGPGAEAQMGTSLVDLAKSFGRRPPWTNQQYQELDSYHRERAAVGRSPTKDCAGKFGIDERTVRKKLREWEVCPSNPRNLTSISAGK